MSRYKKVLTGESELKEIGGEKFLVYPTLETRMELLELIKEAQAVDEIDEKDSSGNVTSTRKIKGMRFKMIDVAEVCAKVIFEACWEHNEKGQRTRKKEEEADTSYEDILDIVCANEILTIYSEILIGLEVFDKEKVKEFKKKTSELKKNGEPSIPVVEEAGGVIQQGLPDSSKDKVQA